MSRPVARLSDPSYELINPQESSSIFTREHGFPSPLVRWHYHKEYELHLITHSSGKVFVGDYIGNFYPGNLILTRPNLPHNWISQVNGDEFFPQRDQVVTFTDELIQSAREVLPEMTNLDNLLQRARFGIRNQSQETVKKVRHLMQKIIISNGLRRLAAFLEVMSLLAETDQYQLLSSDHYLSIGGERNAFRVNQAVNYISEHYNSDLSAEEVAEHVGMQPAYFSKFFRQATGRRFVEFVKDMRHALVIF